jgi:uncharacterized repeat protein (TIGR01451 family)
MLLAALIAFSTFATNITNTYAWGPERTTYTCESPAGETTFNSITNRPLNGSSDCDQSGGTMDERQFVYICEYSGDTNGCVGNYVDEIALEVGKSYQVYIYFHNNAAENLNPGAVSNNARVSTVLPHTITAGSRTAISGTIYAANANPASVWDETYVTSSTDVNLSFYPASAVIYSNGAINGTVLPANGGGANGDILNGGADGSTGALIGYDDLNGAVPGCAQFSGWVTYRFVVDQPNFSIQKTVSLDGTNFAESVAAKPGDEVTFKIVYQNTGTEDQLDVNIKDTLPSSLSYIPGSTYIINPSNPDPPGLQLSDNIITEGVNIGNYGPGTTAEITFVAKVTADRSSLACGQNSLLNSAKAITNNGTIEDTAEVTVDVNCNKLDAPDSGEIALRGAIMVAIAIVGLIVVALLFERRTTKKD